MTTREPDPSADEHAVLAPVPDPTDDLTDLAIFADGHGEPETGGTNAGGASAAAYDDETDLAVPVHQPDASTAFTPFGGSVPDSEPGAAYDSDRDTGR